MGYFGTAVCFLEVHGTMYFNFTLALFWLFRSVSLDGCRSCGMFMDFLVRVWRSCWKAFAVAVSPQPATVGTNVLQ